MRAAFVICEYNPFHLGHAHHIKTLKTQCNPDVVVGIMSGNFLQRGTPALCSKFQRAQIALAGGVDLVLEMPLIYATSSAEFFARGGVGIASSFGENHLLCFGSESGSLEEIITAARLLLENKDSLDPLIRAQLKKGHRYPKAREEALVQLFGNEWAHGLLGQPNNILALEYAKEHLRRSSPLTLHTIPRQGMGYHEEQEDPTLLPSATALRSALAQGNLDAVRSGMPEKAFALFQQALKERKLPEGDPLKDLLALTLTYHPESLMTLPEARDGLGERMLKARGILRHGTLKDFQAAVATKRYPNTRIQRLILHACLGLAALDYETERQRDPRYSLILSLNEKGAAFLAHTRGQRSLPIVQSLKNLPREWTAPDVRASECYHALDAAYDPLWDFTHPLRITPSALTKKGPLP
ncbi:hypothetical protein ABB02_01956 [Clostridiaceae bacterium JG1575]|nr:hypothetical protein ABB02_01956 [Clostridiaceae bacterium JG1575]